MRVKTIYNDFQTVLKQNYRQSNNVQRQFFILKNILFVL